MPKHTNSKKLIAGPWVGEFGWFLFAWQGRLRWLAKHKYEEVTIVCRPGQECVFEDFAKDIIVWDGYCPDAAAGRVCLGFRFKDTYAEKGTDRVLPGQKLTSYHWRQRTPADPTFSQQEFIMFGEKGATEGYDVLFHIRSTTKVSQGYKNAFKGWDELLESFKGLRVACIGTTKQAAHIPGTDDKRDVSLRTLANIMRSSKVLVGASSGPVHFAALCGLPHVTWVGRKLKYCRGAALLRYTKHWNPFKVTVRPFFSRNWNPSTQLILDSVNDILKGGPN